LREDQDTKEDPKTGKSQKWTSYPTDTQQNPRLKTMKSQRRRRGVPNAEVGIVTQCWRIKDVSTYNLQAYGPTPFSPWDSQGSCQSAEQGDYKRLIYLYSVTTQTLTMIRLEKQLHYTRGND
jgi:hypothetical protein